MSDKPILEGVAIVGVAGRFPGANTAADFWRNIKAGVESISFFSDAELAAAGHDVAALKQDPGFVPARGIIDRPEWFDAQFFGMTPLEAEATDPQQRVLLEVAAEALEEAGYDVSRYPGAIGVYAGVATNTYYLNFLLSRPDVLQAVGPMQAMIGREKDFVATRIAYKLNLKGPALNVNSACSTSLVAVCQAVQSLLTYQCDMALAGGATIAFPQHAGYVAEEEGISSPDGHTRTFDADAQGTTFGNGAGMVVLKRLEDAVTDGDHIYAVIKGAALNNDGSDKASFMAPSAKGHAEVIAMAHALAGMEPRSIGYIEAHGTATPIGDPIEIAGLTEAFRSGTSETGFCAIGSVKTNVGHLEIAAGVAGLIKTAFSLHERLLAPSLHYRKPNPRINFADSPFFVNTVLRPWSADGPRRAGVSSFGIGGTNAHVVLEEPPAQERSAPSRGSQLLLLSARSPAGLDVASANLSKFLSAHEEVNLADVAFTLQSGRRAFPERRAVVTASAVDAAAQLSRPRSAGISGKAMEPRAIVLAFSGGGASDHHVSFDLCDTVPVFREAIARVVAAAPPALQAALVTATATRGARPAAAPADLPALFAMQYGLAITLQRWGVDPVALVGSGVGTYVAASLAGVLTLEDAWRVLAAHVSAANESGQVPRAELLAELRSVVFSPPRVPIVSNTSGGLVTSDEALSPEFWLGHATRVGRPLAGLTTVLSRRDIAVLAVGPDQPPADGAPEPPGRAAELKVVSLDDRRPRQEALLAAVGELWAIGCDFDWRAMAGSDRRNRVALPTYPFERKRYCADPAPAGHRSVSEPGGAHQAAPPTVPATWHVLPLSATTPESLADAANHAVSTLNGQPDEALARLARELQARRPALSVRRAVVARSAADAVSRLLNEPLAEQHRSPASGASSRSVIFMFAGGGAQYAGAAYELFRDLPIFRDAFDACCRHLDPPLADAVMRLMRTRSIAATPADRAAAERPSVGLPFLFAVEYGLVQVWRALGVSPVAMIGHSLGEYTAACVSGVLSLEDAVGLVAIRGALFDRLERGSMMAVPAPPTALGRYLGGQLDIAAVNGPSSCVISGPVEAMQRATAALQADDIDVIPLHIDVAAHSAMVEPAMAAFGDRVRRAKLHPPTVPFVSNVTGKWISSAEATDPDYWVTHLRQTVRFSDGVSTLCQLAAPVFLEVGPGRVLTSLVKGHPSVQPDTPVISSVRHPSELRDDGEVLGVAAARLWVSGVEIEWPSASGAIQTSDGHLPHRAGMSEAGNVHRDAPPLPAAGVSSSTATPPSRLSAKEPRRGRIAAGLRGILQDLGAPDAAGLAGETSFVELGFDSLSLTQVAQAVRKTFGVRIKFRQLLETIPTIDALAAHIDGNLPADAIESVPASPPEVAAKGGPVAVPAAFTATDPPPGGAGQAFDIRAQLALMSDQIAMLRQAVDANARPSGGIVIPSPAASAPASPKRFGPYVPPDKKRRMLDERQSRALEAFIARYTARTRGSKALTDQQRPTLADARAVTGFKAQWKELIYQIAMTSSAGSRMVDVDGNEYVDFTMNFGASLFGHSPAFLTEAVDRQLRAGIELGTLSPLAAPVSKMLARMTGLDRVAFANTGTDAIMGALRAARTVTGRDNVIMFRGGYHGMNDEVLAQAQGTGDRMVVLPAVPGVAPNAVAGTIVLDYEDPDCLDQLRQHLPDAAAVLVEPIQSRRPAFDARHLFGQIRELTRAAGTALIFDELITGFRLHPRGAQGWFGVDVDLATYGKILGNGVPVAAIAGRAEFMEAFDGGLWRFGDDSQPEGNVTFYGGTHTRHPLGLAAAHAVLTKLEQEGPVLQEGLNAKTVTFCERINAVLEQRGVSVRADHAGSMFLFRFPTESDPGRGRASLESSAGTLERLLFYYLREQGIHIWDRPAFLSTAHTSADLDRFIAALESSADEMLAAGFLEPADIVRTAAGLSPASVQLSPATTRFPLSPGQKEIWLATQAGEGGSLAFNQCISLQFDGPLSVDALRSALNHFVARHEALRMVFATTGEWQEVMPALGVALEVVDCSALPEAAFSAEIERLIEVDRTTPFDLARGPLYRFIAVRQSANRHVLIFDAHHIICDGWSVTTFVEELGPIYRAVVAGETPDLPPAAKFTDWVRDIVAQDTREDEAYWLQQFSTPVPALEMPTDRPRPPLKTYQASTSIVEVAGEPVDVLRRSCAEAGTTMFVGVLSAYALLLHTLSGQTDVVIGCAAAGQNLQDESLVGHCVSLLPVRLHVDPAAPVADLLAHVRRQVLDAFDHQSYTYGQLIEKLDVRRDASRQPLLSTLITYEVDSDQIAFGPLAVRVEAHPRRFCNFEIELHVRATRHELLVWLYFHPSLFDQATADRWTSYLVRVLGELGRDTARPAGVVPAMSEEERDRVVRAWNDTQTPEKAKLVLRQIADRAIEAPERVAVEDDTGSRLTRRELAVRSDSIARHVLADGSVSGAIGLCVDRSVNMVAAVLGILKAGGAYLPLDSTLPLARLEAMLDDAGTTTIIVQRSLISALPSAKDRRVIVLEDVVAADASIGDTPLPEVPDDAVAYVIYTSGSTGRPKGVAVTHRNLSNLLTSIANEPGFTEEDTMLAVTTLSFDVAASELLLPLVTGGRVVVASREVAADGSRLLELMDRVRPTFMHPTPVTWRLLLEAGWTGAPQLTIGSTGEALPRELADRLADKGRALWNLYGPTETAIWSTIHKVSREPGIVPIGKPIANTQTYVLNASGQPVPIGVRGELYIGGVGVTPGYLNRPELTAERFVPDPFGKDPRGRLYRTGDAARYRPDGTLECLERLDHQVKLRGFRIELGEIEAVLQSHPGVSAAVVVLREDTPGNPRLVAYVAPAGIDAHALRESARQRLPEYMVPGVIVGIASLPLTASGKVDRKALPSPSAAGTARPASAAPRTVLEAAMVELWRDVLKVAHVGIDDNFFDLGGHSLLAVRLVMRIKERWGHDVSFGMLLTHPTVADLAAFLEPEAEKPAVSGDAPVLVTLQPEGDGVPIFFVHGIDGDVWGFVELARRLGGRRPVYGLQPSGNPEDGTTVERIADRYLREVKRVLPEGPYLLGGFCSGAAIAYEMAQQIQAHGGRVGLLAAIDYTFFETLQRPGSTGAMRDFLGNALHWVVEDAIPAGPRAIAGRVGSKARLWWAKLTGGRNGDPEGDVRDRLGLWRYLDHQVKMLETYARAFEQYKPQPYRGRVALFRARTLPLFGRQPETDLGWSRLAAGGVDVHVLAGSHETIMKLPFVKKVASALEQTIVQATSQSPRPSTAARQPSGPVV